MSSLHLINKSSFRTNSLANCLELLNPGDEVLLLEDGAYCALDSSPLLSQTAATIYVIDIDLSARGINTNMLNSKVQLASYEDFVHLSCKHQNSVSWS